MFSSVSGLGVAEAVLRSLAYLKSVILYLWMPCVVLLDLLLVVTWKQFLQESP